MESRPTSSHRASNLFPSKVSPLSVISDADYNKINSLLKSDTNWIFEPVPSLHSKDKKITPIQYATYLLDIRLLKIFKEKIEHHSGAMKEFSTQIQDQKTYIPLSDINDLYVEYKKNCGKLDDEAHFGGIDPFIGMTDGKKFAWNELSITLWRRVPMHMLLDFCYQTNWSAASKFDIDDTKILNPHTKTIEVEIKLFSLIECRKNQERFIVRGKNNRPFVPNSYPLIEFLDHDRVVFDNLYKKRMEDIKDFCSILTEKKTTNQTWVYGERKKV